MIGVQSRRSSVLLLLGATSLWGTSGPAEALARAGGSPAAIGAARLLVGGVLLAALTRALTGSFGVRRCVRDKHWLLVAAVSTGVFQATFFAAVNRTGAGPATLVTLGAAPVMTGLFARTLEKDPLGLKWGVATTSAVTGLALLTLDGGPAHIDAGGVGLALVAAACYGAYTIAAKRLLHREGPIGGVLAATLIGGGLVLSPALALAPSWLATAHGAALVAWLGPVCTTLAYGLFVAGLAGVPAPTAGTLALTEPLVAVVIAVVLLGERLSPLALVGGALLLAGIAVAALPSPSRASNAAIARAPT